MKIINRLKNIEPWHTLLLVPVYQEFIFRYLPFKFWYLEGGNFWVVGIVSSLIFASIHWYFGKWFTLYTFFGGLVFWWFMVNFDLLVPIALHAIFNIVDLNTKFRHKISGVEDRWNL